MKHQPVDNIITNDTLFFFDMDGTLVDTNKANYLAYNKAVQSVMHSQSDLIYDPDKRVNRSILKSSIPYLTEVDYQRIIIEKEKYYSDFLNEMKLIDENINILNKYSETHKTFLVTNCRKDRAMSTLSYFGLASRFTEIYFREFGAEGEKINKYKNAISILGVSPKRIIVFENEESEIIAAKDAGIEIINPKIYI